MPDMMQMRRDTAAHWALSNPKLKDGELGFETDTRLFKLGDGVTDWNSLPYYDTKVHLTQEQYDALPDDKKLNGDWYFIEE